MKTLCMILAIVSLLAVSAHADTNRIQMVTYLSGLQMQSTDSVLVKTDDGITHSVLSVVRENGSETPLPEGTPDVAPYIVITLANVSMLSGGLTDGTLKSALSNLQMQDTDPVMFKTEDGIFHALARVNRYNGEQQTFPQGAPEVDPYIVIQLAQ